MLASSMEETKMNEIEKIRQILNEQKNRFGLVRGKITLNEYDDAGEK